MQQLFLILHVLIAGSLVVLILLQRGRGSDAGATFGSGASNTMFGSAGSMPFLTKLIGGLALIFFLTSLGLGLLAAKPAPAPQRDILLQQPKSVPMVPVKTKRATPVPAVPKE